MGAAVKKVGKLTFETCKDVIDDIIFSTRGESLYDDFRTV